eukprot:3139799-Prymnesium_polylepis.1
MARSSPSSFLKASRSGAVSRFRLLSQVRIAPCSAHTTSTNCNGVCRRLPAASPRWRQSVSCTIGTRIATGCANTMSAAPSAAPSNACSAGLNSLCEYFTARRSAHAHRLARTAVFSPAPRASAAAAAAFCAALPLPLGTGRCLPVVSPATLTSSS